MMYLIVNTRLEKLDDDFPSFLCICFPNVIYLSLAALDDFSYLGIQSQSCLKFEKVPASLRA